MNRIDQINDMLKKEIAAYLSKNICLENILATITKVECSPDLRNAKISISILPDGKAGSSLKQIRKHAKDIASHINKQSSIRKIPRLSFVFDPSGKHVSELDKVFEEIEKENRELSNT